jgi:hypothetical protein
MAGKRNLDAWRIDADACVPALLGRIDEDRLGEVDLARKRLQRLLRNPARIREDG